MLNLIKITAASIFCLFVVHVFAQKGGVPAIDTLDLRLHLAFISSDSLQGRSAETAFPGLKVAAGYLSRQAEINGLIPLADSYFQPVKLFSLKPDIQNTGLHYKNSKGETVFKTDSVVSFSGMEKACILNSEIVFAGFGWQDKKTGFDDFENVDMKGKTVLFCSGTPDEFLNKSSYRWNNRLENEKMKRAASAGASAVIVLNNPLDKNNETFNRISRWMNRGSYFFERPEMQDSSLYFMTTSSFGSAIFGKDEFNYLLTSSAKKVKTSMEKISPGDVSVCVEKKTSEIELQNVVGMVEGSDPVLKNECVVFMAHYDHLGVAENGDVFNGADDNGSGTVTLLELAQAFSQLEKKPRRSILFLWVSGEELGMIGSRYYCSNPLFDLEKTRTCINLDMVGRVYEPRDSVWKNSPKQVKDFDGIFTLTNKTWPKLAEITDAACRTIQLKPDKSLPEYFLRSSDHYSFHEKGVPVLNLATGYHADYHQPGDEISKINFQKMKRVADLCFLIGFEVANQ